MRIKHEFEISIAPMCFGCAGVDFDVSVDFGRGA
jgi:hypothetical protein